MVKKRNEAGARGLSPEGSAAEAKRMRRQTAKDDRARRRGTGGTPRRAQGGRQRAGGGGRGGGRGHSAKGMGVRTEPQAPVAIRAAFSAATSDPRAASGVLVARLCGVLTVRLRARSCACPPRLGSPW